MGTMYTECLTDKFKYRNYMYCRFMRFTKDGTEYIFDSDTNITAPVGSFEHEMLHSIQVQGLYNFEEEKE